MGDAELYDEAGEQTGDLTAAAGSAEPLIGLRSVRALRLLAERLEELQVHNARALGWSWQDIAEQLGVSRQAVHKKHAVGRLLGRGHGRRDG